MKIYSATETNFNNNGYGILRDVIECYSTEFLNGQYDIKFIYPVNGYLSEYLIENNIVKVDNGRDEEQLFRIKIIQGNVSQNSKEITVIANHITFDLEDNFLIDVRPTSQNGAGALDNILSNTQYEHNFTSNSDIEELNTAYYIRKNVISALVSEDNNFCERWNAELLRNNFEIYAKHNIGVNRGIKIQYGRNFKGLTWSVERDYVTRIMPQGSNELILPEKFIDSPLIENYPNPVIRKINFNEIGVIENEITEEEALNMLRDKVYKLYEKGIDKPTVSLELDMIDLSKTTEYSKYSAFEIIKLGDTITANLPQFNLDTQMKVTGLEYDCLRKKNSLIYLSNKGQTPTNSITDLSKNINAITGNLTEINNLPPKTTLQLAKENASDSIKNAMGGFATKTESEYLVLDTGDINTAQKVGRWNVNGLGFSNGGINGVYDTTITSDGKIVLDQATVGTLDGQYIKAGTITADKIDTNVLTLGGSNLIKNSVGYFTTDWENIMPSFTNTDVQQNTVLSKNCFFVGNGTMKQIIQVQNGVYTLSLKYKKLIALANVKIKINDFEIILDNLNWSTKNYTFEVLSNTVEISVIGDTLNSCYLTDLMLNIGIIAQVWSSAPGESVNGGTKIGNGVEVDSSTANTKTRIDHDGNRTFNKTTGEVVMEATDKGVKGKRGEFEEMESAKLLFTDIGNQTWISRL